MSISAQMSGVVLTGHGGPEKLEWRNDFPIPELAAGDVLVQVGAAAVNNTDVNTRLAWYSKGDADTTDATWSGQPMAFPRIQGADICGEIVAVADGVNVSRIGERVLIEPCLREANGKVLDTPWYIGSECDGGFAQYVRVASRHAFKIKSNLSDAELACFPCSYSTAENMLTRTNVQPGDRVLVTGASGGVGSAAVQLARARGAKIIAITSSHKAQTLIDLGASSTIARGDDYVSELGANSVDVVLDLVAGEKWRSLLDLLRPGGKYAAAGAIAGPIVELDVRTLYLKDLSLFGCTVLESEVFPNLIARIEQGDIQPLVAEKYHLKDIAEAQASFLEKNHIGKIILEVD